jgi:hypothetical protein
MRRLQSSYNEDHVSDQEVDEVFCGTIQASVEVPLASRTYGERILYVGFTSKRAVLVEIGVEDQEGELVVFHTREATQQSAQAYEEGTANG